jgi:Mg/Co/Ni transporter MgtE
MEPEERKDVEELLEFHEDTAAGRMTTEYLSIAPQATVEDAIGLLRGFEGGVETVSTIYLVDADEKLVGAVPLANLVLASAGTPMSELVSQALISVPEGARENEFTEIVDKYNLLTLPVVDEQDRLTGVITADDVITLLRSKL